MPQIEQFPISQPVTNKWNLEIDGKVYNVLIESFPKLYTNNDLVGHADFKFRHSASVQLKIYWSVSDDVKIGEILSLPNSTFDAKVSIEGSDIKVGYFYINLKTSTLSNFQFDNDFIYPGNSTGKQVQSYRSFAIDLYILADEIAYDNGTVSYDLSYYSATAEDEEEGGIDASVVTYEPSTLTDWNSNTDPGNVDDALNQLAERVSDVEVQLPQNASATPYTPSTLTDWNSSADPGSVDDALDQLASRVDTVEDTYQTEAFSPAVPADWNGTPTTVIGALNELAERTEDLESERRIVVSKTTTYTANAFEIILCNSSGGGFTINLPSAASNTNKEITVKKISSDGNTITIDGNLSETIDGELTLLINSQWDAVNMISNGSNWFII